MVECLPEHVHRRWVVTMVMARHVLRGEHLWCLLLQVKE